MAQWNRGGREDEHRHLDEDRRRRESGGRDRWAEERIRGEERSFDERRQDWRERGGYAAETHRRGGFGDWPERRLVAEGYGYRPGYRGGQSPGEPYGRASREEAERAYARGGVVGDNEAVRRVADGEFDRSARAFGGGMQEHAGEHRGRGPKNYTRSDERIREDVNDRLSDDSWLDASEIEVLVEKCEVTLGGLVNSRDDKRRAEDLAEQVSGVKHVQNNLRIQPGARADLGATPNSTPRGPTGSM